MDILRLESNKDDDLNRLPQRWNTHVDEPESSPRISHDRVSNVLPVQPLKDQ